MRYLYFATCCRARPIVLFQLSIFKVRNSKLFEIKNYANDYCKLLPLLVFFFFFFFFGGGGGGVSRSKLSRASYGLWAMGLLTLKYSRVNVKAASSLKAETEPPITRPINEEMKCLILAKF